MTVEPENVTIPGTVEITVDENGFPSLSLAFKTEHPAVTLLLRSLINKTNDYVEDGGAYIVLSEAEGRPAVWKMRVEA